MGMGSVQEMCNAMKAYAEIDGDRMKVTFYCIYGGSYIACLDII